MSGGFRQRNAHIQFNSRLRQTSEYRVEECTRLIREGQPNFKIQSTKDVGWWF